MTEAWTGAIEMDAQLEEQIRALLESMSPGPQNLVRAWLAVEEPLAMIIQILGDVIKINYGYEQGDISLDAVQIFPMVCGAVVELEQQARQQGEPSYLYQPMSEGGGE